MKIILLFALWRIWLLIPLVAGEVFLSQRLGYHYTLVPFFTKTDNPINHFLLSAWGNFDGIYYLLIASRGYTVEAGFFPFFPLLIRFISFFFGGFLAFAPAQYLIAILIVTGCFVGGLWIFYRLLRLDYSKKIAWQSLLYLVSFPTAFYFATLYTESTFFLLTVSSFWFARKKQWLLSGIFGALLSATRPVGIAILPALFYEWYTGEKQKKSVSSLFSLFAIASSLLGFLSYAWFNAQKWGNPLFFMEAQVGLHQNRVATLINPLQTLFRYGKILVSLPVTQYEWWVAMLEVSAFLAAVLLFFIAWKKQVRRSYIIFALGCFLIPTMTGTFIGVPRYILVLFPLWVAMALWIQKKSVRFAIMAVGFVLQAVLLALFSKGYFVA